jgi:HlyD family secretion protein
VIIQQKENVLMVPNRAIRTEGANKVVDVKTGEKTEPRVITTGMVGDQNTEVLTGVNEGDMVTIPMPTLTGGSGSSNTMMMGGGMGVKQVAPGGGVTYSVISK